LQASSPDAGVAFAVAAGAFLLASATALLTLAAGAAFLDAASTAFLTLAAAGAFFAGVGSYLSTYTNKLRNGS